MSSQSMADAIKFKLKEYILDLYWKTEHHQPSSSLISTNKLLISIPEAALLLSIAASTGRDWISKGIFPVPTVKINGRRLVSLKLLEQYVEDLTNAQQDGRAL